MINHRNLFISVHVMWHQPHGAHAAGGWWSVSGAVIPESAASVTHLPLPWGPGDRLGSSPHWIPAPRALSLLTLHTLPYPSAARAGDHWGDLQLSGIFLLGFSPQALLLTAPFFLGAWGQAGLWTQPELLGPEGRSCRLHYRVWLRGSTETLRNLEGQCPRGQSFSIHPTEFNHGLDSRWCQGITNFVRCHNGFVVMLKQIIFIY